MFFQYALRDGWRQPVVPVVLVYGRNKLEYEAVVDSGAETTLFDVAVAQLLNIDLHGSAQQIETVSGHRVDVMYRAVKITVGKKLWTANVGFTQLKDPQIGLLGHLGFLDHFRVTLDYRAGEFSLEPYVNA